MNDLHLYIQVYTFVLSFMRVTALNFLIMGIRSIIINVSGDVYHVSLFPGDCNYVVSNETHHLMFWGSLDECLTFVLEDAISTGAIVGTAPHNDFRINLTCVNTLIGAN
jgi:hypothetical protein